MFGRRTLALGSLIAIVATLLGPIPTSGQSNDTVLLRIAGDQLSGTSIIPEMIARFLESHGAGSISIDRPAPPPGWKHEISGALLDGKRISVLLNPTNTGGGIDYLRKGLADIALAARPITPAEARTLAPLGDFLNPDAAFVMARTGFVVAVARTNHVPSLGFAELRAIYSGRATDWSQVGGSPGPIHPFLPTNSSALYDVFNSVVMSPMPYGHDVKRFPTFQTALKALQADPSGLALIPSGNIDGVRAVPLRTGKYPAALPDAYGLVSGDYPLSLQLTIYHAPNPKDHAREIADFIDEAGSITSETDILRPQFSFYRVTSQLLIPDPPGPVPSGYSALMHGGLRISTTIHFPPGVTTIGPWNSEAMSELTSYLRFIQVPPDKVHFVAFSDDSGNRAKNRAVSDQLAATVQAELDKQQVKTQAPDSYGATAPLASDFTAAGRTLNRRVETWIVPYNL